MAPRKSNKAIAFGALIEVESVHRTVWCSRLVNKEGELDLVDARPFIVPHGKEFSYEKVEMRPVPRRK